MSQNARARCSDSVCARAPVLFPSPHPVGKVKMLL